MAGDLIVEYERLFLGSRLKRLAETLQGQVINVAEAAGLPIQPSQYPLLATLDVYGPQTIGELTLALQTSQPNVTRTVSRLVEMGLIAVTRVRRDQRHKTISLTAEGRSAIMRSKLLVWPRIDSAVGAMTGALSGSLFDQITALEQMLADRPLDRRALAEPLPALSIREFSDDLAPACHDINAEWIEAMYRMEETDREVLDNPRSHIVDRGGAVMFVEAAGAGIVGTCALQKTGERQFELTKMGVLEAARGCKAGEFLLAAVIERAFAMGADCLYLLSNKKSAAAVHLYEKLGFVHDAETMARFGSRYERCDVAMRYVPAA